MKPQANTVNKRWFRDSDSEIDLFIWQNMNGDISRLQFWFKESLIEWDKKTGIKTGHVEKENGAFVHYQSELYRLHHRWDNNLLAMVKNMLQNKTYSQDDMLTKIKNILFEISKQSAK